MASSSKKSLFISNLPVNWSHSELRHMLSKHCKVVDVFVPQKLSGAGKRFGFIRVQDQESWVWLVQKLNGKFLGDEKLVIKEAQYERKRKDGVARANKKATGNDHGRNRKYWKPDYFVRDTRTYAKVVTQGTGEDSKASETRKEPSSASAPKYIPVSKGKESLSISVTVTTYDIDELVNLENTISAAKMPIDGIQLLGVNKVLLTLPQNVIATQQH